MDPANDVRLIAEQERLLRFSAFDADAAWRLGGLLRSRLVAAGDGGSVEIEVAGHVWFSCITPGATPGQADWIRRKRNTVRRFAKSSYAIGRGLEVSGEDFEKRNALSLSDYAAHGGGFPLYVQGVGCIGSIVVSGLPQRDDHALVVDAIAEFLHIDAPRLPPSR